MLVGNKVDLETCREVSTLEAQNAAREMDIGFIETSAKLGHNVNAAFEQLVRRVPRTSVEYKVYRQWGN